MADLAPARAQATLPIDGSLNVSTSFKSASGVFLDVDLCSTDWVDSWRLKVVSVVDAASGRVVIAIPAHTPGFVTDGKRTLLKPGECLSAVVPVPPGATHRALILRFVGKNMATKEVATADLPVSPATLGALAITDSLQTDAGALTAKQVDFFEAWAPLAPLIGTEEDQAGLYADLKAQALSGKGGAP